jgi:CDP-4-dehydro-6-deoxyglucose reductase
MALPPTFTARIAGARMLSPQVREIVLERAEPLVFQAGQWVSIALPSEAEPLRRSYSIASAPDGTGRFEIAVTRVEGGPGSMYLHAATVGTELSVTGPQGFFTRSKEKTGPSLFVGTGTGVTPLRSMLRDAVCEGDTRPLWLLFGVRTEADMLYREELDELAARHPQVRVIYTLSRPREGWSGRRGYVQTHVRELWTELAALGQGAPHAYVCGLHRMVGAVRDLLRKEMTVPREQVHSERYD